MIYKILSAVLLLGNVNFSSGIGEEEDSMSVSHETREEFDTVAHLLGVPAEDLERGLVNKTSYIRKEVVTTVLKEEGAIKQRDSLMCSLYAILFSYIVESANHRLYPGDEAIKELQRDREGASIVMIDIPGFQTKSPSGALLEDGSNNSRRATLIQAYGEDGYEEFIINYQNELLQHWLFRRNFVDDACDAVKNAVSDGVIYTEVDAVDTSEMTLELLRGGVIGSRADSKTGGLLAGLGKACSGLRKGKITTEHAADESFLEGMEERYKGHTRYLPRVGGITSTSFAIKHYTGTVAYSARQFVDKDLDLLDSDFVRLFRNSSSESFLCKLFSGPSLAAESHPRDPSVLVATQISSQPLRRLSPLKVSKTASTSVPFDPPEPDIEPVTTQVNHTLTNILAQLNEVPVWHVSCIRPNDHASPGVFDIRRVKSQVDSLDLRSLLARKRVDYIDNIEISKVIKRYSPIGASGGANKENVEKFLQSRNLEKGRHYTVGAASLWLSYEAWFNLEMALVDFETRELTKKRKILAETKRSLEEGRKTASSSEEMDGRPPGFAGLEPSPSQDTFHGHPDLKGGFYAGESSDDLLKNAGTAGGYAGGHIPTLPYDSGGLGRPNPNYLRQSALSFSPSNAGVGDVWGSDFRNLQQQQPHSPGFQNDGKNEQGGSGPGNGMEKGEGGKKGQTVQEVPTSGARRTWLIIVWTLTWWIPGFLLGWIGRMKRPDVRIAWREKVALCMLVVLFCGMLVSC
jgi:chitin synthase